jgi:hypothetical protein
MNSTIEQIKPETLALIAEQAYRLNLSIDEYLRRLLPVNDNDLSLRVDADEQEFEIDMLAFAEDTSSSLYQGSYLREDIYFDHD